MKQGERCVVRLKQGYGYDSKDCSLAPPAGFPSLSTAIFDIQLLRWHPQIQGAVRLILWWLITIIFD